MFFSLQSPDLKFEFKKLNLLKKTYYDTKMSKTYKLYCSQLIRVVLKIISCFLCIPASDWSPALHQGLWLAYWYWFVDPSASTELTLFDYGCSLLDTSSDPPLCRPPLHHWLGTENGTLLRSEGPPPPPPPPPLSPHHAPLRWPQRKPPPSPQRLKDPRISSLDPEERRRERKNRWDSGANVGRFGDNRGFDCVCEKYSVCDYLISLEPNLLTFLWFNSLSHIHLSFY